MPMPTTPAAVLRSGRGKKLRASLARGEFFRDKQRWGKTALGANRENLVLGILNRRKKRSLRVPLPPLPPPPPPPPL
jgi:hypothetical protein